MLEIKNFTRTYVLLLLALISLLIPNALHCKAYFRETSPTAVFRLAPRFLRNGLNIWHEGLHECRVSPVGRVCQGISEGEINAGAA